MPVIGTEIERNRITNPRARTADLAAIALRTNLCTNPSAEANVTGYAAQGGSNALTQSNVGANQKIGSYYARVQWTAATGGPAGGIQWAAASGNGTPVNASMPYAFSWYIKPSKNQRLQLSVEWRTAANAVISTSTATAVLCWSANYTRLQLLATAPATAAFAIVRVLAVAGTGGVAWAIGDFLAADGLLIEQTTRTLDYFDASYRSFGTTGTNGDGTITLYDTVATVRTNLAISPSGEIAADLTYIWSTGTSSGHADTVQSTLHTLYGSKSIQVTKSGVGSAAVLWQVAGDSFQPGDQYTFSAYVWSPTNDSVYSWGETVFLDRSTDGMVVFGNGTPGSMINLELLAGQWTRVSQTFTIPAGGLPASQVLLGFGIADGQVLWVDGVLIERTAELRPYFDGNSPSDGLETHAWGLNPATGVAQPDVGVSRRVAPHPKDVSAVLGANYWQYASGGVGVLGTLLRSSAAGSGISWTSPVLETPATFTLITHVRAVDAVNITALGNQTAALAAGERREFRRVVATGTGAYSTSVVQNDAAPKQWVVEHYAMVPGGSYAGPYFDGSTPAPDSDTRYTWAGTPDASETIHELLPAPDLTAVVDTVNKGVQLLAEGIPQVTKVTIQRVVAGYPIANPVGAVDASVVSGAAFFFDNAAPLGVPVSYQTRATFNDGSQSGWSDPITVTIPIEANEVWLKDIGQPLRSTRVILRNLGGKERKSRTELHDIQDSELPIAISGKRRAAAEDVVFGTTTETARSKVEALLATGQVVLLQCPPGWGRTDAYVALGDYREVRLIQHGPRPERNWQVTIQEVVAPSGDRTGLPNSSYRQVKDDFASYRALLGNRASYLGVLANSSDVS